MIQPVQRGRTARTANGNNGSPYFMAEPITVCPGNVKGAVEEAFHCSGDTRIMNGRTENQPIDIFYLLQQVVKRVRGNDASFVMILEAHIASHATVYLLASDLKYFKFDVFFL